MIGTIMAMRYNKMAVFTGSSLALTLMSGLSCLFGTIIPEFVPKIYT
jgi:putative Ca2+/H+ antiporter (TMEM165/GDT1 family)